MSLEVMGLSQVWAGSPILINENFYFIIYVASEEHPHLLGGFQQAQRHCNKKGINIHIYSPYLVCYLYIHIYKNYRYMEYQNNICMYCNSVLHYTMYRCAHLKLRDILITSPTSSLVQFINFTLHNCRHSTHNKSTLRKHKRYI